MNPTKPKLIVYENHEQSLRKSTCQAGAWRSFWERQAPAWLLHGMFFIGYRLTLETPANGLVPAALRFGVSGQALALQRNIS